MKLKWKKFILGRRKKKGWVIFIGLILYSLYSFPRKEIFTLRKYHNSLT